MTTAADNLVTTMGCANSSAVTAAVDETVTASSLTAISSHAPPPPSTSEAVSSATTATKPANGITMVPSPPFALHHPLTSSFITDDDLTLFASLPSPLRGMIAMYFVVLPLQSHLYVTPETLQAAGVSFPTSSAARRILKEYRDFIATDTNEWHMWPRPQVNSGGSKISITMDQWDGYIMGQAGTPYEHAVFGFTLDYPERYPFMPFKLRFTTPICHANINEKGAFWCTQLSDNWTPARTASSVITWLRNEWLIHSEVDDEHKHKYEDGAVNHDLVKKYRYKPEEWAALRRAETEKNASLAVYHASYRYRPPNT